ncbi:MAG: diaminopimelate decarboxylase [Candidatus Aminicenantes bacterium]|nr:diaminopimelate decarboxylase [Candidatus Aminicenantes bacterium]
MAWWEHEGLKIAAGRLRVAGRSPEAWAAENGTPVFVYSGRRVRANLARLRAAFDGAWSRELRVAYAVKANPCPGILGLLREEAAWIDAVSPREVEAARRAGFPASRVLFTGTSLGPADFRSVFGRPGLTVAIDAVEQIAAMAAVRRREFPKRDIRVSVRWNPGIGSGFNPKVITAGARSGDGTPIKFGVEESRVLEAFEAAAAAGFTPVGLHQHLGSGWTAEDYPTVLQAVERMIDMSRTVVRSGFGLEFLDFGGGFGPRYAEDQKVFPLERYAHVVGRSVARALPGLSALVVEPGKFLVADAGVLLVRVNYLKRSYGNLFACVDAGTFNTLPRTAIYGQAFHQIVNAARPAGRRQPVTVAGHLCETGDVFGKDHLLVPPRAGELLAILGAGAYGRSMASEFNLRPIAPEVLA